MSPWTTLLIAAALIVTAAPAQAGEPIVLEDPTDASPCNWGYIFTEVPPRVELHPECIEPTP